MLLMLAKAKRVSIVNEKLKKIILTIAKLKTLKKEDSFYNETYKF